MQVRMALLPLVLWGVGCSNPADTYPQAWSLDVSPQAVELVEDVGWDAVTFYELVCVHAESIADGTGLTFDLDGGAGLVGVSGKPGGELGVLGFAVRGSARAEVELVQVFNYLFGHAPGRVALTTYSIDEAARMVAAIVTHEVGHALTLPHNDRSSVMRALPDLDAGARHAFTPDEIAHILRVSETVIREP